MKKFHKNAFILWLLIILSPVFFVIAYTTLAETPAMPEQVQEPPQQQEKIKLFYVVKEGEGDVSQNQREHFSSNRFLAIDIATAGKKNTIYAPAMYGKEVEWNVEYNTNMNQKTVGTALILTSKGKNYKILIGHASSHNGAGVAKTGEPIGTIGGCPGDTGQGVSTGCHAHIEYYIWDVGRNDWSPLLYTEENFLSRHF